MLLLALIAAVLARPLMSGLDRNFRVPFFALVRHVAPDRAYVSDAVLPLVAFAAARPSAGKVALRFWSISRSRCPQGITA